MAAAGRVGGGGAAMAAAGHVGGGGWGHGSRRWLQDGCGYRRPWRRRWISHGSRGWLRKVGCWKPCRRQWSSHGSCRWLRGGRGNRRCCWLWSGPGNRRRLCRRLWPIAKTAATPARPIVRQTPCADPQFVFCKASTARCRWLRNNRGNRRRCRRLRNGHGSRCRLLRKLTACRNTVRLHQWRDTKPTFVAQAISAKDEARSLRIYVADRHVHPGMELQPTCHDPGKARPPQPRASLLDLRRAASWDARA